MMEGWGAIPSCVKMCHSRGMVIVLLRITMRADADLAAYEALGGRMDELVRAMPGFVSVNYYTAADGDAFSLVTFESAEALAVWRDLPEHVEAQRQGRQRFYSSYSIQVCEVVRAYQFPPVAPSA